MNMERSLQDVAQDLLDQFRGLVKALQKNPDLATEAHFQAALAHLAEYQDEVQYYLIRQKG